MDSWQELGNFFQNELNLSESERSRCVSWLSLNSRPVIDIVSFDDILHEKYGDYEKEGMSMKDFIYKLYSPETAQKLEYYFRFNPNLNQRR